MAKLGVNIDHVATLREARRTVMPDPVKAASLCERSGCDSIVCHLREDRRHIKDADVALLRKIVKTRLNLEMSVAKDIVDFACRIKPDQSTLVPEKRQEITTEGGLDVAGNLARIKSVVSKLANSGIEASLFINPAKRQIEASGKTGAKIIELHTGRYANAASLNAKRKELEILKAAARFAQKSGFEVNAGHGLDYDNVKDVADIEGINELNIGHSIIARAIFVGIGKAVKEMVRLVR
ncbi:MAG: pyridoxine 5'-phosphate synthase [Candidatus Omnitrophica bacterium]|nr:pyridoxine 5'-phosphate synthase [Candidatus Omnitrophota bacterium]